MLDLNRLHQQIADFNTYQSAEQARLADRLEHACAAFEACHDTWELLRERVRTEQAGWLVPGLREAPAGSFSCGTRPTPITVVATDGSQVYPDRHVEPTCYLINISRIAFQYGTLERPLMESVPDFRYRRDEMADVLEEGLEAATADVVSALRDEQELHALLATALECRIGQRPIVAVADGTLIRWMLGGLQNRALTDRLIARYTEILDGFRCEGIPVCSYISMPGNTEVVNLVRLHLDEHRTPPPPERSLAGLPDRWLFERRLRPGERSATFESASHIQRAYGEANRICYFYLCLPARDGTEIGRVEVPQWVADDPALLDLVHAVLLSECEKGDGYPMILSEAHERAVVRAHEKALLYDVLERQLTASGLRFNASRKQASKRRPVV